MRTYARSFDEELASLKPEALGLHEGGTWRAYEDRIELISQSFGGCHAHALGAVELTAMEDVEYRVPARAEGMVQCTN